MHGKTVAEGWTGALMQKPLAIKNYEGRMDGQADGPTYRHGKVYSGVSATKKTNDSWMFDVFVLQYLFLLLFVTFHDVGSKS